MKNPPKNSLGGFLGGSRRFLPSIFENWRGRSVFWDPLGAVLGGSWGRLGAWIAVLGRLGASWGRLGPSKNRCQNRSKNRCLSRSIFDTILVDFGRENGSKLAPKSIKNRCQDASRCVPMLSSIFWWIFDWFWWSRTPKFIEKIMGFPVPEGS